MRTRLVFVPPALVLGPDRDLVSTRAGKGLVLARSKGTLAVTIAQAKFAGRRGGVATIRPGEPSDIVDFRS